MCKTCDQCSPVRINGLFAHEQGCINQGAKWDRDEKEWIRGYDCKECGCFVKNGETCSCLEFDEMEEQGDLEEVDSLVLVLEGEE